MLLLLEYRVESLFCLFGFYFNLANFNFNLEQIEYNKQRVILKCTKNIQMNCASHDQGSWKNNKTKCYRQKEKSLILSL